MKLAEHMRRFKRQHQLFNRFKKYKPFRPVFPILFPYLSEDGLTLNEHIEVKDEMVFTDDEKRSLRKMNKECMDLKATDFELRAALAQLQEKAGIEANPLDRIEAIQEEEREYSMAPPSFSESNKKRQPNGCARAWWKFAITSVIKDNRQKSKATW
mmetsp:Transcript_17068/g.26358  ORF Transcript_17068/g.26358 Transcript_17068/m.26358 type:complete len:156 (-) Transcript_17068:11782-12249(-)